MLKEQYGMWLSATQTAICFYAMFLCIIQMRNIATGVDPPQVILSLVMATVIVFAASSGARHVYALTSVLDRIAGFVLAVSAI